MTRPPNRTTNLRILTISHMFPSAQAQRHGIFICREARQLREHGIECEFLVGRPWTPWPLHHVRRWRHYGPTNPLAAPFDLKAHRVAYFRPPGMGFRRFEGKSLARAVLEPATRLHRENPFSAVLGVSMLPDAEAAVIVGASLALPVASLAVGSDVMVYPERLPALRKRLGQTLAHADLPIGVSRSICRELAGTGQCRREPVCVYLSGDTNAFTPAADRAGIRQGLGWWPDNIVAVYVGGLVASKGIEELAAACEPLMARYRNFRLVCVGDGPGRSVLEELGRRTGRVDAVELPGGVAPDEVPRFLQGADFLVLPSHSEGLPQAVVEAMLCGLPAVASDVGGVAEAVVSGQTGLLVKARDVEDLRQAMERMIVDEVFRQAAGRRGYKRARTIFDPERNAQVLAEALKSLVPGDGRELRK